MIATAQRSCDKPVKDSAEQPQRVLRILLLEDEAFDAELISRTLERGPLPNVVKWVSGGPEFVAAITEFQPDIILADVHLPGFSGNEALAVAHREYPDIPFIFV